MLTPQQAAFELIHRGHNRPSSGMDDPTEASYPMRWWWDETGVLCFARWRCAATRFDKVTLNGALVDAVLGEEAPE